MIRRYCFSFMLFGVLMLLALSACGKRPDVVDAPDGTDAKAYPRTYPDLGTDPPSYSKTE